eukprot:scaffold298_cov63-Phaeocystis_antarctica.AAC.2
MSNALFAFHLNRDRRASAVCARDGARESRDDARARRRESAECARRRARKRARRDTRYSRNRSFTRVSRGFEHFSTKTCKRIEQEHAVRGGLARAASCAAHIVIYCIVGERVVGELL